MIISNGEKTIWRAVVIRKDGTRHDLGVMVGGTRFQKVVSYLKIKLANFKHYCGHNLDEHGEIPTYR